VLHRTNGTGPSASGPATSNAASSSPAASPAGTATSSTPASSSTPSTVAPPPPDAQAATVRAYYAAINNHHYARAWRLGGRNSGTTYQDFVNGFATTAHDAVTIQSVSGDTVTAQVTAEQTDGTVKTYQGTYTVNGGVITQFNVQQTS
jgi:hypothetical protein